LVSHGELAGAMLETASEIVGPIEASTVSIGRQDSLDKAEEQLRAAIERVDQGNGVLLLVDMFGGTASNLALRIVGDAPIEIVTGMNLPMVLKLASALPESTDLLSLAQLLRYYGQRHVLLASEYLKEREEGL
jgi:PTS system mannose-specific IIA component